MFSAFPVKNKHVTAPRGRPAKKTHVTASGRLAGGRLGWTYRDFPISQAQPATAGRPQAEKNMSQLFPASGQPARRMEKHVTAPRGRPSEKNMSQLWPPSAPAQSCDMFFHEKSRCMDFSNGSGGPDARLVGVEQLLPPRQACIPNVL